jgi:cephalosporin hydroxylase
MAEGGSALWFADMQTALGIDGRVVTVDQRPRLPLDDPRIEVVVGEMTRLTGCLSSAVLAALPRPWLVIEDTAHTFDVSLAVLRFFDGWLQPGDYIVIEDGVVRGLPGPQYLAYEDGPSRAIEAFLAERGDDYDIDVETCDWFGANVTYAPNGWLRRRAR